MASGFYKLASSTHDGALLCLSARCGDCGDLHLELGHTLSKDAGGKNGAPASASAGVFGVDLTYRVGACCRLQC